VCTKYHRDQYSPKDTLPPGADVRKLLVDGDDILGFAIDGIEVRLKERIPIGQYEHLKPVLEASEKIDLTGSSKASKPEQSERNSEWTNENLQAFVQALTDTQRAYLEVLAANGEEWLFSSDLCERLKEKTGKQFRGTSIAGIRSGLSRKARNWYESEHIDESAWNSDEWMTRVRIKPKYLSRLRKLLGIH